MRALVVDDEESVRKLLTRLLTIKGWEVETAADGQQALALFQPARFEIALLDVNLPGELDGIALADRLREQDGRLRILIMSGNPGNAPKAEAAGFGVLIQKPFDLAVLGARLQSLSAGAAA